ncbi:NAD(P)-dependent oxidoreductase [Flavobacteriaceae bacterium XHP0103]|uniref:NAD-dependent epimerase/dehydratase family protein n=1 Tax=Marixanthotalea marina TaxID=2844359 RepID=UPI002989ECA3|nr:NAD(P)-dependent oxidoreductase [Marixanthotalea marina]MBU3822296.1 NAD(P)-dependent oxidoreductase [Marixanthotalea marina]
MVKQSLFITGADGFLGHHLVQQLAKTYHIVGLVKSPKKLKRLKVGQITLCSTDDPLDEVFERYRPIGIVHTATKYGRTGESVPSLLDVNVNLPIRLLELSQAYNSRVFINIGSFITQGKGYNYLQDYALSKKQCSQWLQLIANKTDTCKVIDFTLYHPFGPGDSESKFVSHMIKAIKWKKPFIDLTPGEQKRDFIYVADVVAAIELALSRSADLQKPYTQTDLGTGSSHTLRYFLETLKTVSGNVETELRFGKLPYRDNEIMEAKASPDLLASWGWKPNYTLNQGLLLTLNETI